MTSVLWNCTLITNLVIVHGGTAARGEVYDGQTDSRNFCRNGVIGLVCGLILGVIIGREIDLILGHWFGWRVLFGGVFGTATGIISGAGTGLLGVRTRFGLEWLFFIVVIIPIGFFICRLYTELDCLGQPSCTHKHRCIGRLAVCTYCQTRSW